MGENKIIEITKVGISYANEQGEEKFIEFSACYEQYLKHWSDADHLAHIKKVNNMDDDQLERFLKKVRRYKEIGRRNPLTPPWADGPYIEFYTEPLTRFRLTNEEYNETLDAIAESGWKTFDLS